MAENARPERCLPKNTILTPHPGEAARLLNITTSEVQRDRIGAALKIAERSGAVVVLKGAGTVIATPSDHKNPGRYFINPTGNPGMASGGMGDALSGMIAAFMAQGLSTLDAAKLGVYLHGAAADAAAVAAADLVLPAAELAGLRLGAAAAIRFYPAAVAAAPTTVRGPAAAAAGALPAGLNEKRKRETRAKAP